MAAEQGGGLQEGRRAGRRERFLKVAESDEFTDALAGAGKTTAGTARQRARSALVVAQMALSVMLLATAGLLARSLGELRRVDPGFDPRDLLTMEFRLPATKYDTPEKIAPVFERMLAEVRATPGVRAAALVRAVPLGGNADHYPAAPLGEPTRPLGMERGVVNEDGRGAGHERSITVGEVIGA